MPRRSRERSHRMLLDVHGTISSGSALSPAIRLDIAAAAPAAQHLESISNDAIRRALRGDVRAFFRGLLLTIAALDTLERAELPANIDEWCTLALTELHATANMFRASGLPIPTDVPI